MKKLFLFLGIFYILVPFILVLSKWGELQPAYKVNLELVIAEFFGTIVPFILGFIVGNIND